MRSSFVRVVVAAVVLVVGAIWFFQTSTTSQSTRSQPFQPARTADGKPDLNGIWQALNTANFDIQGHASRPALALMPAAPRGGRGTEHTANATKLVLGFRVRPDLALVRVPAGMMPTELLDTSQQPEIVGADSKRELALAARELDRGQGGVGHRVVGRVLERRRDEIRGLVAIAPREVELREEVPPRRVVPATPGSGPE